ncbi:MAG: hypothetical protein HYW25_02285 [Candidatus Aenigmarchaeota archaeon]|nr:hypothetical protein [Candidatus Aenigmarchaeota archaeon]
MSSDTRREILSSLVGTAAFTAVMLGGVLLSGYIGSAPRRLYESAAAEVRQIESRVDYAEYRESAESIRSLVLEGANDPVGYKWSAVARAQEELERMTTPELRVSLQRREELNQVVQENWDKVNFREKMVFLPTAILSVGLGITAGVGTNRALKRREEKRRRQDPYTPTP